MLAWPPPLVFTISTLRGETEAAAAAGDARAETRCAARRKTKRAVFRREKTSADSAGCRRRGSFRGAGTRRTGGGAARGEGVGAASLSRWRKRRVDRADALREGSRARASAGRRSFASRTGCPASSGRGLLENVTRIDRDEKRDGSARTRCAPWRRGRCGWPRGGCGRHRRARGTGGRRRRRTCSCACGSGRNRSARKGREELAYLAETAGPLG